ncbi:cation channel sperm-associated targeting subunit tau isoform X2 [Sminthopsis crassicaudata]|uniref:cation channel sperm-associated targeting subunit tau isoform X2 n=1 Tax=Sminthopsis crassicaudata TaxID=9301 RepID=UPI003D69CAC5
MEPSQTEKKASDLSESQRNKVHSLFKVPFLHKSETGADENDESRTVDTTSQASSLRQTPSSRNESSRDGSKSGTGRKLLNMLRKTLKGSETKDLDLAQEIPSLVPFGDVVGCLAVHIKKCRHFSPRINLQYYTNLFIRITINKIMKCTKAHSVNFKNNEKKPAVKFDEVKYFSVQVPRRQDDERNMIYLELMEFDDLEAYPVLLGSFSLHLYEIIQKGCFTEEFYMKIRNLVVCKVEVEFMFSYGNFGYGFSHQLKPLQKLIQPSMFMHIPPPVERTDPLTNVITPQPIEYPAFLSPDLNVTVGTQQKQTNASSPVRLEKLQQQPRDRLDRMKKEYRNLKTWEEKSKYLDQILRMKTETKESPDPKDTEEKDDLQEMDENPLPENVFQTPDSLFKKQEAEPLSSELPVNTPEVKSPPLVEKEAEPSDSSLIIQEDAEIKNESLPLEESTPLTPVSLKEKDISVESIDRRDDELVLENIEPEEEMEEKEISASASLDVEPKQSQTDSEKTDSIQSETKLKSIILSPDRKKKSIDESGADSMRQESKRSSELLQDLEEDIESVMKMSLPRHVSFNISDEGVELPSKTDDVLKIEEHISLDRDKDKIEKKEKNKEGVDEKTETENIETDEENEIIIRNTYMEDLEDFTFIPARPESIPIFQGYNKPILIHKGKFEPFLRNITEIPINEDHKRIQNEPVCTVVKKNTSSAEIIEHEDQDPPYAPTSSSITVNSENSSWDSTPDIFTIKSFDTEEIERRLSSISLESFEGETAFTVDIDLVGKEQENLLSELLELNPSLEKLEKTVVLKSILNDDLKDLSDELFSKQGILREIEAEKKSQSLLTLDDKTLGSLETVFENAQNEIKIVHSEQLELSGKKSSKSSKKDLKIMQSEQLGELLEKRSSSSKSSKNDLKIVQSEQLSELSRKRGSSSKSSFKNGIKNVNSEPLSELSGKKSSSSKSFKNDLKIVQSEQIVFSGKTSSSSKSFKNDFKFVQSEQFSELSKELSSDLKSSPKNLKTIQSEQLSELSGKISSGSKFSKTDLRIVQSEQIELSGKISSSSKSFKSDLKIMQSEQLGELLEKKSSSSKSSKSNLKIVLSEQLGELLEKKSLKSSKNDFRIVQSEQLGELSEKTSSDSKSSLKTDLKIMQSEGSGEHSEKTSLDSKPYKSDLSIVQSEQLSEHLGKKSSISKPLKTDLKIVQSEQLSELSEKTSLGSKTYKSDLSSIQSEQSSEYLGKKSLISKPPKNDLKIVQSESLDELSEKTTLGSKSSKSDLKIVQSEHEQSSEHSEKKSLISKPSKSDLKIVQGEQLSELLEKKSSSSKSFKTDLKTGQSEQMGEYLEKKSLISKPSKTDFKIVQGELLCELLEKKSSSLKSSKSDLKIVQSEQLGELLEKKSSSSKSSKSDLKTGQGEQVGELLEKKSSSSKSSKSDLKTGQGEQVDELLEKTSSSSKPSKTDLKIVQNEQLIELSEKTTSSLKSSKTDLQIVKDEQVGELLEKTSSSSKPSKTDLKIVQGELLCELLEETSSSSESSKTDLKTGQGELLCELLEKTSSSSNSSAIDLKIGHSEQSGELLEEKSSSSESSKTDLKTGQGELLCELLEKKSSSSKSSETDLKTGQGELLCELLEKTSSSSNSSETDLKIGQSEQLGELLEEKSSSSKSSKSDLKTGQGEQVGELLEKKSSSSKSSKTDLKTGQGEQVGELLEKKSSSSESSKTDLKTGQGEQVGELLEKKSSSSKSSKSDLKTGQGEQVGELLEKKSSSSKSSKSDLKTGQGEQVGELLEKKSSSSKSSKSDLKTGQGEQVGELLEKKSSNSKSSKSDLKTGQGEQVGELLEKKSSSSKSSKSDLKTGQGEQVGELLEKKSSSSKSSKSDLKTGQGEQVGELLEKKSSSSKPSKSDLKTGQGEQVGELLEKKSSSSKSSKSDLKTGQGEQVGELLEKKSSSSKSSKSDLKTGQGEQLCELLEKKSSSSKSSKTDLKTGQGELLCELLEKKSSSSKSSKSDLKTGQSELLCELLEKKSSSSKSSKTDLKTGQGELLCELLEKKSSSSKSSKSDLKTGQDEQLCELLEKKSSSSKSSKTDLKTGPSELLCELLEKKSSSSKSSKSDLKTGQGEQLCELLEKKSSSSKSSKTDPQIVQGEQLCELLEKKSSSSKSSKTDLKTGQDEHVSELLEKKSSNSKSSKSDLKIVQNEQLCELLEKKSSSSKSSKSDLKIAQGEQLSELLEKKSSNSKSSKNDLKIVQGQQLCELLENQSSSSKSSKNDLKTEHSVKTSSSSESIKKGIKSVLSQQLDEFSGKTSSSSKSSLENDLKILHNEQNDLSLRKILSLNSFSKEILKDDPMEISSGSQIEEITEKVEKFYIPLTYEEPEEQLSILEEDFSNGRKHSFKKKHPEEYFQKNSEEVIRSFSVLSIAESFESPENVAFIEQISSEPNITELDLEHGMPLMDFPNSLTVWDSGLASTSEDSNEKLSGVDGSKPKSFVRHIFLHAFPSDSLESGIVSVIELDKGDYQNPWLDTETNLSEEKPTMMEEDWNLPLKNSKNQFLQDKDNLPQTEKLYREKNFEEKDLNSVLESASNYIMHKLSDSDRSRLKSFATNVFKNLSTENIPEPKIGKKRQNYFVPDGENDLEELDANSIKSMGKSDDLNAKHAATPKRSSFEEFLSGSEAGHLSSDLGKHIQSFLVENLSESGKFPKGDLPKLFEKLYLVNNKKKSPTSMKTEQLPKGQNNLKDFPDTSPKSPPPVNNSNRPLSGDKHLEIRLRALLSEILEQYILSNYAETKLTSERESDTKDPNLPPHRTKTVPPFSYEVRHDYPERSFSGESDINRDLTQSIQDLLLVISENELLNLKSDLSKHLQSLFIERLSNMGLITEREFHALNENLSLINSSDRPLKFLNSDLRGLNQFLEKPSEKQNYKTFPRNMSQDDEKISNIELARKLEREYITLHNIKRRSVLRDDERQYPRERVGKQGLTGVKASRKSSQEFLLNTSERITKLVLRREQKDYNVMQLPQVEKTGFEEDFQDLHGWYNRPKTNHSKATLKIKPLEKKEHYNIYKVTVKEKPEPVIPGVQNSEVQPEIKEYLYKYKLPSSGNSYAYLNSEDEEESNLKDYCYGKSKENNKKKPLLTVTQFQKELQAVYVKTKETTTEKCSPTPQSFDHSRIVELNNLKSSIFPEVLKTESLKPKNRREREYVEKQKRPLYRTAKILAASQPTTRLLLRKSPQRTLLFPWTGKRNIHDSSENKKEDIHLTSFKHLEKAKARVRFDLGKSPEDNQYTLKNLARPNTAPEFNKRLKENFGKFTSPRVVSAGLFHLNVTNPSLEEYNQKKDLKDLEKCSIICDILQLLNSSYVKRKYEDDY